MEKKDALCPVFSSSYKVTNIQPWELHPTILSSDSFYHPVSLNEDQPQQEFPKRQQLPNQNIYLLIFLIDLLFFLFLLFQFLFY